jgi:hypothetical protein
MGVLSRSCANAEDAIKTPQANKANITRKAMVRKLGPGPYPKKNFAARQGVSSIPEGDTNRYCALLHVRSGL